MHVQKMRQLLHELANKISILQGSLDCVMLGDIPPGTTRESLEVCRKSSRELCAMITATREAFFDGYRQDAASYKGEPPLLDKNGVLLKFEDEVLVPDPEYSDDYWVEGFRGSIASTTVGDGMIAVKSDDQCCWFINARRVQKLYTVAQGVSNAK